MDDLWLEPYKLILRPKVYSNAIYVILIGKVSQMPNTIRSTSILRQEMLKGVKSFSISKKTEYFGKII